MKTNIGWQDAANPHKIALLDKYLTDKKELNILELAAGYGWYSRHLHNKGHKVTALDIEINFREPGIQFKTADLEQPIALESGAYDVIVAWDIIEHLRKESQIIQEIKRLAKPGALIFVSVPHADDSRIASRYLTYSHFKDKTHQREYTPESLTKKFETIGLRSINVVLKGGDGYPYVILNFIDNNFWKFVMKILVRTFMTLRIIEVKNCHGDIFAIFSK